MAFNEWLRELSYAEAQQDLDNVPNSFYHYAWASDFCCGKRVIELDCLSGFGTGLLSKLASSYTGISENRDAIKHAQRNFFVDGKTKFAVGRGPQNFAVFDVIVWFDGHTLSRESITRITQSIFTANVPQKGIKGLVYGMTSDSAREYSEILQAFQALSQMLSIKYSVYGQSRNNMRDIRPHQSSDFDSIHRLMVVLEGNGGNALPADTKPALLEDLDLVSIVIPTYNRADLIGETIESALRQSYPRVEVIVVDDGSKDNTKDVVARYGEKVKYYYKENGGIGSALNHGIKQMTGRWFKWVSSDDVLTHDAVEVLVNYANETGAMIMYTDYDIVDGEGKLIRKFVEPHFSSYYEYASALWTRYIGNGSSSLIEKACFDEVGVFDESLRSAEDYDWWLRACLLHGYRFFHIPRVTLKYRTHGNQLTAAVKHDAYLTDEKLRNKIKRELMSVNPAWWDVLIRYQKLYSKQNQRGNFARRLLRRSLLHMPEGMRKSALKTWHESLKPRIDDED